MDIAPLTNAHTHVRNASLSLDDAVEQHIAAADDFARTAVDVQDIEALRILKLLEQEHRRLAQLVKPRSKPPLHADTSRDDSIYDVESPTLAELKPQTSTAIPVTKTFTASDLPKRQSSPVFERHQVRSSSSSIANNLASARGIPTAPHRHTRHNIADERRAKTSVKLQQTAGLIPHDIQEIQDEDPFQKFYAGFEGLWSKLSAPLAFAGLPLMSETITEHGSNQTEPATIKRQRKGEPTETPRIDSIYSKAAMRAIREDRGPVERPQESFYVVPDQSRTGVSQISLHDEDDLFEDAQESPQTAPLHLSRPLPHAPLTSNSGKTMEELELENASMKTLTDNLSKRLYMWEKNAQSQTAAMQQSIRTLQPLHIRAGANNVQPVSNANHNQLEEQLRATQKELDQQKRENTKLKTVILRYRERWDKLKEGARVRREGNERGVEE